MGRGELDLTRIKDRSPAKLYPPIQPVSIICSKQHQRGIVRAFTRYCLTLRSEILFPLGWLGSSATQMTRRSPYRQLSESGVA